MSPRSDGCSDMGNAFWLDGMTNLETMYSVSVLVLNLFMR